MGSDLTRAPGAAEPVPRAAAEPAAQTPAPARPVPLYVGAATDPAEVDADRRAAIALGRLPDDAVPVRRTSPAAGGVEVGASGGALPDHLAADIERSRGTGQPLARGVRVRMETAFGTSFSAVRLHTDETASRLNR